MSQLDRHLTTEQLSASLDGQAEEQSQIEGHLKSCDQCRQRLTDLRQTVALLRALPQPELPRSFMLPIETSHVATRPEAARSHTKQTAASRPRVVAFPGYLRNTIRAVSTLAALLGIVFLFSALPLGHGGTSATTGSGSANNSVPFDKAQQQSPTSPSAQGSTLQNQQKSEGATATAQAKPSTAVTPPQSSSTDSTKQQPAPPLPSPLALTTASGRAIWGAILLIISIIGALLLRRLRQQL